MWSGNVSLMCIEHSDWMYVESKVVIEGNPSKELNSALAFTVIRFVSQPLHFKHHVNCEYIISHVCCN